MPRLSAPEIPQRRSARRPAQLRTSSSSDSDPTHHRSALTDRSPKVGGLRPSPRGSQSEPAHPKKLGTRIADLESQLGQAQVELKSLKEQLVSAEAAKKAAQEQLERKARKAVQNQEGKSGNEAPGDDNNQVETDVFEVPIENVAVKPDQPGSEDDELKDKPAILEAEKSKPPFVDELALKDEVIGSLKTKLAEKEKELGAFIDDNQLLQSQVEEKSAEILVFQQKEAESRTRINEVSMELEACKNNTVQINEKLQSVEKEKAELEAEMKKLRVQTEQWRKAADAAAAVLSGGVEMNGRRISERCGSMDKHFGGVYDTNGGGYNDYMGSPGLGDDTDDRFGGGKRKSSGIKMFDIWKKKGQK